MKNAVRFSTLVLIMCLLRTAAYGHPRNVTQYPGSDIGQQINAAYEHLPPTGGALYVPAKNDGSCYQFVTPIQFATLHKTVVLTGDSLQSTCLQYLGSGTAVWFDYGFEHYLVGATLKDLTLQGTGNQGTGLLLGGSHGAEGTRIENVRIAGFALGVTFGVRSFLSRFDHVVIDDNVQNLYYPPALPDTGENVEFDHVLFTDNTGINFANSVVINAANGSPPGINFVDCSFDAVQVVLTVGYVNMVNPHFENAKNHSDLDYVVVNGAYVNIVNPYFLQNYFSGPVPSQLIRATEGLTVLVGVQAYTNQIIPRFMLLQGSASALVLGEINVQNFTTDILKDVGATGYASVLGAYGLNLPFLLSNNASLAWRNNEGLPTEAMRLDAYNNLVIHDPGNIQLWNKNESSVIGGFSDSGLAVGSATISTSGDAKFNTVTVANPTTTSTLSPALARETGNKEPTGRFGGFLSFGNIGGSECKESDIPAAGALKNSPLAPAWPLLEPGLVGMMYAPESDNVRVRLCNFTKHSVASVTHYFSGRVVN